MQVKDIIKEYQFYQNKMVYKPAEYVEDFKAFLEKHVVYYAPKQKDIKKHDTNTTTR